MDENRLEGLARNVGGRVQDAVGGLTGDANIQARGKANQMAGQAQDAYGQMLDEVRDFTTEQPLAALLSALGIGVVLGMLFARR